MVNPRTTDRTRQSTRTRLDLVEEVITGRATLDIASTALAVDTTDGDWFEDTAGNAIALSNLQLNDSDIDWITLDTAQTPDTLSLDAGRYVITMELFPTNTNATLAMDYRFGLTDDAATPVALFENGADHVSLPASSQGACLPIRKSVQVDLTDATNVIFFVAALATASHTGAHLANGMSQIIVERLG